MTYWTDILHLCTSCRTGAEGINFVLFFYYDLFLCWVRSHAGNFHVQKQHLLEVLLFFCPLCLFGRWMISNEWMNGNLLLWKFVHPFCCYIHQLFSNTAPWSVTEYGGQSGDWSLNQVVCVWLNCQMTCKFLQLLKYIFIFLLWLFYDAYCVFFKFMLFAYLSFLSLKKPSRMVQYHADYLFGKAM